ncbi:MAG TPA: transglutaminase family protein [Novosphingobium sp.]|nr:transglutaminase family protein [Novosphingobium sp.]
MRIAIEHNTTYRFETPAVQGVKRLRLRPRDCGVQNVLDWTMTIGGGTIEAEYEDHNQNQTLLVSFDHTAEEITISCRGTVETRDTAGVIGPHHGFMPLWVFLNPTPLTKAGPLVKALAARFAAPLAEGGNVLPVLHDLSDAVAEAIVYEQGHTGAETTAEEALALGRGVCQDHAHAFIAAARVLGVPARYVSGYLLMEGRIEQAAGHAWVEAHVPGLGWVGFDISNAVCPDGRHVRLAIGVDYRDAAPVTSVSVGGGEAELSVSLAVAQQVMAQ